MSSINSAVWTFLEKSHPYKARPEESLMLLAIVALARKIDPESFFEVFKLAPVEQKSQLNKYIQSTLSGYFEDDDAFLNIAPFSDDMVRVAIYTVADLDEDGLASLAPCIRNSIQRSGFPHAESISSNAVVELFNEIVGSIDSGTLIYDGAAGYANIVSQFKVGTLYLEEYKSSVWAFSKALLLLEGKNVNFRLRNSLVSPIFLGKQLLVDIAVVTPPFAMRFSEKDIENLSPSYLKLDKPPRTAGDSVWIQQTLAHLNDTGKALILISQGWLFRGGYDAKLREHIIDNDLLESVIQLPAGVINSTNIEPVLIVLNKNKEHSGVIHMVDAGKTGTKSRKSLRLAVKDVQLIAEMAKGACPTNENYKPVLIPDIIKNNYLLNVSEYVIKVSEWKPRNQQKEIEILEKIVSEFKEAQAELNVLLEEARQ